jgi:hypothetical protein
MTADLQGHKHCGLNTLASWHILELVSTIGGVYGLCALTAFHKLGHNKPVLLGV